MKFILATPCRALRALAPIFSGRPPLQRFGVLNFVSEEFECSLTSSSFSTKLPRDGSLEREGGSMDLRNVFIFLSLAVASGGCAVDIGEETPGESSAGDVEEIGSTEQEIAYGQVATHYPTVKFTGGSAAAFCSGVMISKSHFLTAAHCLRADGWIYGRLTRQMCYYGACWESNVVPAQTACGSNNCNEIYMWGARHPSFVDNTGDWGDDLAVVTIWDGYTIPALESNTTLATRVWLGDLSVGQQLDIYGWGYSNVLMGNAGGTKMLWGTMSLDYFTSRYLRAQTVTNTTCAGDSGGPALVNSDKLAGITSGGYSASTTCALYGENVYFNRLRYKMPWIEAQMAYPFGAGYTCRRFGTAGSQYARCW